MIIRFDKLAGKTIAKGQITVPKACDTDLDKQKYCALGNSVKITYCLRLIINFTFQTRRTEESSRIK